MGLTFEWHDQKDQENLRIHSVGFDESCTIFGDLLSRTIDDPLHSTEEDSFITIGLSSLSGFLVVAHI